MTFNNSGLNSPQMKSPQMNSPQMNNLGGSSVPINKQYTVNSQKNISLNAPMIGRVHNAKSGCSACGKKVA